MPSISQLTEKATLTRGALTIVSDYATTEGVGSFDSYSFPLGESLVTPSLKGDGVTDMSVELQALVDYASANNFPVIYLFGAFVITRTIFVPARVSIMGTADRRTSLIPKAGGVGFTLGFMLIFNSTDGVNWSHAFPFWPGTVSNIYFNNDPGVAPVAPIRGALAFGQYAFTDCRANNMTCAIKRPLGAGAEYIDQFKVTRLNTFLSNGGSEYQVDIIGSGDNAVVEECQFYPGQLGIRISGGGNSCGTIRDCTGGNHLIQDAKNITVSGEHIESAVFVVDRSDVNFNGCSIYTPTDATAPVIQCIDSAGSAETVYQVTLTNCLFPRQYQHHTAFPYQVSISAFCRLVVKDTWVEVSNGGSTLLEGIKVARDVAGANGVTAWNEYCHLLSRNGTIEPNRDVALNYTINVINASWDGLYDANAVVVSGINNDWKAGNGTFYYRAQFLVDPVTMIGQNNNGFGSNEPSVVISGTASIVALLFDGTIARTSTGGVIRLYRGTSSGSYTKYADIPVACVPPVMYDDGTSVAQIPWVTRGAAGIDTTYSPVDSPVWRLTQRAILQNAVPRVQRPGNASLTMRVGSNMQVIYDSAIGADRTVTLPVLVRTGDTVEVIRTAAGTGAFNVLVSNGSTLATLAAASTSVRLVGNAGAWESLA